MEKPEISFILISCCTCKRPQMLKKSLESVQNLYFPEGVRSELLIIDNDKESSALSVVQEFQKNFPVKINYFTESKRGLSSARNRLLTEAHNLKASHIALFDDDEIMDENWLISHFDYYNQNPEAIIISGPTYNFFEKQYPSYIEKNNIFKASTTKKTGMKRDSCAGGNVFFPVGVFSEASIKFDEQYVFMGGEDGDFFSKAAKAGFTIVWNNDAVNREIVNDSRGNLKWILNRYYYNGYSAIFLRQKENKALINRFVNVLKSSFVLIFDVLALPFSLLFGATTFFNILGVVCKTKGKLDAALWNRPLNYYLNICGS